MASFPSDPRPSEAGSELQELTFVPGFGRFLLGEIGPMPIAVGLVAAVAVNSEKITLGSGVVVTILVALRGLYHALFLRSLRRLTVGPSWVRGPCEKPLYGTTIELEDLNWSHSGTRGKDLWLVPKEGESIRVRWSWFSSEQIETIKLTLRERSRLGELGKTL